MSCESTYIQNQNKKINFPFHTVEYSLHKELKVTSEHLMPHSHQSLNMFKSCFVKHSLIFFFFIETI